jgi:hypothetical protein
MKKLAVREVDLGFLYHLCDIGEESRDVFVEAIEQAPSISHWNDFTKIYQNITKVHPYKADRIIRALFNIYDLFYTSKAEIKDFASSLVTTLSQRPLFKVKLEKELESFELFFIEILTLFNKLKVRDNFLRLMPQHQHLFVRSELFSDIRPAFRLDDPTIEPLAAAIVHSLKIVYRKGTEIKDFYLGLDIDDLHQMKGTIERAISKHDSIKFMVSKMRIGLLQLETEE